MEKLFKNCITLAKKLGEKMGRKKKIRTENSYDEITSQDIIYGPTNMDRHNDALRHAMYRVLNQEHMSFSASTFVDFGGVFNANIDTYTIKQYEKDDFENLIQLLTLWIDDLAIKKKVKEVAATFEGEEFSEEDIDKFILALTLEIDDQNIRNKFEETHQYWKNIKR